MLVFLLVVSFVLAVVVATTTSLRKVAEPDALGFLFPEADGYVVYSVR